MQEGMVVAYTGVTLKRNGHVVEVGMQFTVEEVTHGDDLGTCVKLYNRGFGGPFWVPLTDVIAVAGDGVCDADVSQRANMLATLRQMQSAEPQKGEGCNRESAICRMPRPHGTDLTRLFKCGGCCTHGRMPFENGICEQCHTALSVTFDDVTIRHLFDVHLPGMVELTYSVLENWKERCPIHKIEEQVQFRKSTRKYKQKLRLISRSCRSRDAYGSWDGEVSVSVPAEFMMCLVPSDAFTYFPFAQLRSNVQCDGDIYHANSRVECDGGVQCDGSAECYGDVYQADSGVESDGGVQCDVESCRYGNSSEVKPNRAVDGDSANQEFGCVACMERPPNQLMWPCAHLCLCAQCVEAATVKGTCPICMRKITEVVEVFLP